MAFSIFFNVPSGKYKSISNNINAQKLTFFINFKKYNDFFFSKITKTQKIYIYIYIWELTAFSNFFSDLWDNYKRNSDVINTLITKKVNNWKKNITLLKSYAVFHLYNDLWSNYKEFSNVISRFITQNLPKFNKNKVVNSSCRCCVTNHAFLTWMFFSSLWRTIKNSARAGSVREDRLILITTNNKVKRKLEFENAKFLCSI